MTHFYQCSMIFNWSKICVGFLVMAFLFALYPVFNRFYFFNCVSWFSMSLILLNEEQIIIAFVYVNEYLFRFCLCSLGRRSTINQLFLHVVDTAFSFLSRSSWLCGQYSSVFVRTLSVIIHVIGRNLKSTCLVLNRIGAFGRPVFDLFSILQIFLCWLFSM